jgi:dipeptidyl aminopeptidase/acylaminoacyl peptidase
MKPIGLLPSWRARRCGLRKDPWEDEDQWFERPPLRHVKNVRTPLQIIHDENDLRCPMEQAEQFFIALMKLRVPVEFISFPGESHARITGFKKPNHTTEAFKHMLRWFDKYLK